MSAAQPAAPDRETPGDEAPFAAETSMTSPRIAALASAVEAGNQEAVEEFWKEAAETGSPLMEPTDDASLTLVTFLWRDPGDTENVIVLFCSAPSGDLREFRMQRMPGTDLWYRSSLMPSRLRTTYLLSVNDPMEPFESYAEVLRRLPEYEPDPLNPREYTLTGDRDRFRVSVLELPAAPKQPWNIPRRGVPKGHSRMQTMDSAVLGTRHHVSVHTPPGYTDDGDEYHVFLLFDGWSYYNFAAITTVMDNLLYAGRIPPYVLVMHTNEDQEIRARELTCHDPFNAYLNQELMPWVHANYHITSDPAKTVVGGSCFGALAAMYAAHRAPERFGCVISQSGSYWWPGKDVPEKEEEWLTRRFEESPKLPIRFSMDIGSLERSIVDHDPMTSHRNMVAALEKKGYEVDFSEFLGGHDMVCWRGTVVDRLRSFHPGR
ncbi:enterochelin esterase [Streptomyces coelicoflavus]|uniref:enterochelin esterase n=1 Tax=Streptomyces TaxID=1883 RepID=UPI0006B92ECD|nr:MULTISPECIES: enterochelin esterase [unclassified Streptomyces]MCW1097391.1 enterochelin esterase [Streptomyces sp. RS2]NHI06202.1 enterochelin esterase-like enzyme [Streptomyces sp. KO7888]